MDKFMKTLKIGGLVVIGLLIFSISRDVVIENIGSVARGGEYKAKDITTITASTTNATSVKTVGGTIGSFVVAETTDSEFVLYDVSSASDYASPTSTVSTKIMTFPAGLTVGTYTVDASFNRGLAIFSSTTPATEGVITWR